MRPVADDHERLSSARARSASVRRVLRAMADGEVAAAPDTLRSVASLAGRVAFDLAVLERNASVRRRRARAA